MPPNKAFHIDHIGVLYHASLPLIISCRNTRYHAGLVLSLALGMDTINVASISEASFFPSCSKQSIMGSVVLE
jgi:hypothetical protein